MPERSLPLGEIEISSEQVEKAPPDLLKKLIIYLLEENRRLKKHIEELEARLNQDSSNSNRPPSSDSPFQKEDPGKTEKKSKAKSRRGHKGHRFQMLKPTETRNILPKRCSCGCDRFSDLNPYYTHQHIELPQIVMTIIHFVLYSGRCRQCGKITKGYVPSEFQTGFGPRLSAFMVELAGIAGNSRDMVQRFCTSVLRIPISLGAIQKVIDRASKAIEPHYEVFADKARTSEVNHIDETPWFKGGKLNWLWVMTNPAVAFFMIHTNRSREAFEKLIGAWCGILVSDDYGIYRNWVNKRQTCLAHLIRTACGLAQRDNPELASCGKWAAKELERLVKMAKAPPTIGEWRAFFARFCHLIALYRDCKSEAGTFVRRLEEEMDCLFLFLTEQGVGPTNNFGERMIRFAVLWRKRSQGTKGEKGNRWVERILSLRQTCRLHGKSTFDVLVDAMGCFFEGQRPDLSWISQV
ncbi:MAG: IS66 family transposase [Syntrophobacteraceae bacterium]